MPVWLKLKIRRWSIFLNRRNNLKVKILVGYVCFLGFFSLIGERGLFKSYRLWRECKNLNRQIFELQVKNSNLDTQVYLFRHDRRAIEQYARKELRLAGDNEIQYIFE